MKIYVLEEYNTGRTACISEDINMIRKKCVIKVILIHNIMITQF